MDDALEFPDLLRLIDEGSNAFCAAVTSAPSLDLPVPSCPGWTLFDLVQHLGEGRRSWAATVAAGPGAAGPGGRGRSRRGPAAPSPGTRSSRSRCTPTTPSSPSATRGGCHARRPSTASTKFLSTCCATTAAWPHASAVVDYHVTEGRGWRLWLSADGARTARLPDATHQFDAADQPAAAVGADPHAVYAV